MKSTTNESDINQLNSFLRGEISAVETYKQALESVDHATAVSILRTNLASHQGRVNSLTAEVRGLGGDPADGSGPWGAFAKAVEGGAKLFGESSAVAALEEGEDHGLKDYREDASEVSPQVRHLVVNTLLPEQQRTHDALARLKSIMD